MGNFGNLVVSITATTKGLQAGLGQAEKAVSKSSKVLGTLGKAAGMAAVGGLAAAAVGTAALAATMPKLISMGSDAEEMMGKFNVVFGEYAEGTIGNLNAMAKEMGRSKFEMREFGASFQDTFVPLGFARGEAAELSEQLVELTYDVASFNNTLESDTARDFQSAIIGNHETVRKYGIIINQMVLDQELVNMGIEGGVKAATEQEKVQARLNLIMAGTTDAHGDAVRTGGSWANQMRALKSTISDVGTEIGLKLLPVVTPLLSKFRGLAQEWGPRVASMITERIIPAVQMLGENLYSVFTSGEYVDFEAFFGKFGHLGVVVSETLSFVGEILRGDTGGLSIGDMIENLGWTMGYHLGAIWDKEIWPELSTWPGKFWGWLTEPETGALALATEKLNALIASMTGWLAMEDTSQKFRDIGGDIGDFIVTGIGSILGGDEAGESTILAFLGSLGRALLTLDATIAKMGANIGLGIAGEIAEAVAGPEAKRMITEKLEGMLEEIALNIAFGPFFPLVQWSGIVPGYGVGPSAATGIESYAKGGTVPGPIGAPRLAVVHGGETWTPPGGATRDVEVNEDNRVYINTLNLNGIQDVGAFLAELEALA